MQKLNKETLKAIVPHLYRTISPRFSTHAMQRMSERNITEPMIEAVITNGEKWFPPRMNKTWCYKVSNGEIAVVFTFKTIYNKPTLHIITVMFDTNTDIDDKW